jgi:hypothetical protein
LRAIEDDVEKRLLEQIGVAVDDDRLGREVVEEADAAGGKLVRSEFSDLSYDAAEIVLLKVQFDGAREIYE